MDFYYRIQTYKGILFVILASILIFLVSFYLTKKINDANKHLKVSNHKLSLLMDEKVKHQKEVSQAIIKAQENERKQLGEELHDNINQILATTKLYLDIARENPSLKDELMQKSAENIINVITELRKLSKSLSPPSLGDLGLIASIEDLLNSISQVGGLEASFYHEEFVEEKISNDKRFNIYRIIQEQVNNILRHSKAHNIILELKNNDHYLDLKIQDDGVGFDTRNFSHGIGLKNIRNRAELYNGSMQVDSMPGEGCVLSVRFAM